MLCPVGSEMFHLDRQKDRRDEVIISFHNFTKAPSNQSVNVVKDKVAVYSEIHIKHLNTLCWQKTELLNVELHCSYGYS